MKNVRLSLCAGVQVASLLRRPSGSVTVSLGRHFCATTVSILDDFELEPSDGVETEVEGKRKPSSKAFRKRNNDYQSRYIPNPYVQRSEPWTRPTNKDELSSLGKELNAIRKKGKGGLPLGLADLRNLLHKCQEPDHVRYAVLAVELYQKKGNDFKEDVNMRFIKACVKGNNPLAAAHHILNVSQVS